MGCESRDQGKISSFRICSKIIDRVCTFAVEQLTISPFTILLLITVFGMPMITSLEMYGIMGIQLGVTTGIIIMEQTAMEME
jgi:hypothetical protein